MTSEQIIRVDNQIKIDRACRNFVKFMDAVKAREGEHENRIISNKGKTLLTVNRTRAKTVKMTVNK